MGAAISTNTASAISNVATSISQKTTTNTSQADAIRNTITLNDCTINTGEFNVDEQSSTIQSNTQIANSLQKADVLNDIQQKMLQEAASTVGSFGVGFADANNSASMLVNASTTITNLMDTKCSQYSNVNQSFTCDRSTINAKDININLKSSGDFISDQLASNNQVTSVVNKVTQTAQQKATAAVEGLAGFLLALAVLIAAGGYAISKPLNSTGGKFFIIFILLFILAIIVSTMYVRKMPPFFNDDNQCSLSESLSGCSSSCVNFTKQIVHVDNTPLRYIYDLTPRQTSGQSGANLLQMVISAIGSKTPNSGYNRPNHVNLQTMVDKYKKFADKLGIPNIPYPLVVPTDGTNIYIIPDAYLSSGTTSVASICTPAPLIGIGSSYTPFNTDPTTLAKGCLNQISISSSSDPGKDSPIVMANLNLDEWDTYFQGDDSSSTRAKFARYVLCDMFNGLIPLDIYIDDDELINAVDINTGNEITDQAKNIKDSAYCYIFKTTANTDFKSALDIGGSLTGLLGVCDDNTYKYHTFMRHIGGWIFLGLVVLLIGYILYKNQSSEPGNVKQVKSKSK